MNKELIKDFPVKDLIEFERNPRKNKKAVDFLVKSIQRVGNNDPIEINANNIILCGHTRKYALQKLNIKTTDVLKITGLTLEQETEYRITNNKSGDIAEWNFEILEADFTTEQLIDFGFTDQKDIDFDNINSTEDREKSFKDHIVCCPACGYNFQVKL